RRVVGASSLKLRTMRIALITYEFPPQQSLGGVGTYMSSLASALAKTGHQVHVLCGPSNGPETSQANLIVHRIPATFNPRLASRPLRWPYWHLIAAPLARANPLIWHWLRWNFGCRQALQEIAKQYTFDIIEAPEHAANGLVPGLLGHWPLLLRIHCPWD